VVGHWIAQDGTIQQGLLGLRHMEGAHTGENQCAILWQVIEQYSLYKRIGYFTLDNAPNNDVALRCLHTLLDTQGILLSLYYLCECYTNKLIGIQFDPKQRRLRCFGHIVNLVVKAFLYGKDPTAATHASDIEMSMGIEELEDENIGSMTETEQLLHWRRRGPYGRLRNIITFICRTPQRREDFAKVTRETSPDIRVFAPIAANDTRWNGDFQAIKRALELRVSLETYSVRYIRTHLRDDYLEPLDWTELEDILRILEPFHRLTLELEGRRQNGALWEVFPAMDELLNHLETCKTTYEMTGSVHLTTSIKLAWTKLDKYYSLTEFNPVLYAAIALHPSMKMDYFNIAWDAHPAWIESAHSIIRTLWLVEYCPHFNINLPNASTTYTTEGPPCALTTSWKTKRVAKVMKDELEEFLSLRCIDVSDPRQWWVQHQADYPALSKMALEILAIPAMSAEVERVFSSASLTVTDRRNRLGEDTIEAIECQKSWLHSGIISFSGADEMKKMLAQLQVQQQGVSIGSEPTEMVDRKG